MLSILNDTQQAVVETIRMNLSVKDALDYMKQVGYGVSRATYFRHKRKVERMKFERLYVMSKYGFEEQHLERIDNIEIAKKFMWENYYHCTDPYKKVLILEKIVNIQPYLSGYYEATEYAIKETQIMKQYHIPEFEPRSFKKLGQ
jgi:hypothetical protein